MAKLTVSTIIPTYNRAQLLPRAVKSAVENSSHCDEIIVIDDGSTDNTAEVLQPFLDRIRYIKTENYGAGVARNRAIRQARGDLVALLDSDDEWMPNKLDLQRRLFEARPEVLYCFTDFISNTSDGRVVRQALQEWIDESRSWDQILAPGLLYSKITELPKQFDDFMVYIGDLNPSAVRSHYINTDTLVARRLESGKALRFFEDVPLYEEQLCYGMLAKTGLAAYLDIETVQHHSHAGTRLTDANALLESATRIEVTERIWGTDKGYLAKYGNLYRKVINHHRLKRSASLISLGQTKEARKEHAKMDYVPLIHRLLAALPGGMAHFLLSARSWIRALFKGH
jgi:glycosyltransferase involved in cell wall biosynthesis